MPEPGTRRVVVGVDGSPHSQAALHAAVQEARRLGARLEVLHAWTAPIVMAPMGAVPPWPRMVHRDLADEVLEHAVADLPDDVEVVPCAVEGHAASALVEASTGADLLVVGSRGRGGFAGLVLGSTSHQAAAHARCPVLVLPARAGHASDDDADAG